MKRTTKTLAVTACLLFTSIIPALSQDMYKFELMWPRLEQPRYFSARYGVAVDASGNVYVADTYSHRIQKFVSNSNFPSSRCAIRFTPHSLTCEA